MDKVFERLTWGISLVYLDDILVFIRTFQEYQERLDDVFSALEKANITLNVDKCCFAADQAVLLPINGVKSLRGFHSLTSFYRGDRFVPFFGF